MKTTKKFRVPPLKITFDFLQSLSDILESEYQKIKRDAENKFIIEFEKRKLKINNSSIYDTQDEKEAAIADTKEHLRRIYRPDVDIKYKVKSQDAELVFTSFEEISNYKELLPSNITIYNVEITFFNDNDNHVSISVEFLSGFLWSAPYCVLSSENEAALLKVQKDLNMLFEKHRAGFQRILFPFKFKHFIYSVHTLLAITFAVFVSSAIIKIAYAKNIDPVNVLPFFIVAIPVVYSAVKKILVWLFPYHLFSISNTDSFLRKVTVALLVFIFSGTLYDLIKLIFVSIIF